MATAVTKNLFMRGHARPQSTPTQLEDAGLTVRVDTGHDPRADHEANRRVTSAERDPRLA